MKVKAILFRKNSPIKTAKEQTELVIEAMAVIISDEILCPNRKHAASLILSHFVPDWREIVEDAAVVVDRGDPLVRRWRKKVLERDNHTCVRCGKKGKVAHHKIPWVISPVHRIDIDNGITLCIDCHADEHKNDSFKNLILSGKR